MSIENPYGAPKNKMNESSYTLADGTATTSQIASKDRSQSALATQVETTISVRAKTALTSQRFTSLKELRQNKDAMKE